MEKKKVINIELDDDTYQKVKSESVVEDRSVKNMLEIIVKKHFINRDKISKANVIYKDFNGNIIDFE